MSNVTATPATIHVGPRPKPPAVIHTRTPMTRTVGSIWPTAHAGR